MRSRHTEPAPAPINSDRGDLTRLRALLAEALEAFDDADEGELDELEEAEHVSERLDAFITKLITERAPRRVTPPGVPVSTPQTGVTESEIFVEVSHADGDGEVVTLDVYRAFPEDMTAQTRSRLFRLVDGERVYIEHGLATLFEVA